MCRVRCAKGLVTVCEEPCNVERRSPLCRMTPIKASIHLKYYIHVSDCSSSVFAGFSNNADKSSLRSNATPRRPREIRW